MLFNYSLCLMLFVTGNCSPTRELADQLGKHHVFTRVQFVFEGYSFRYNVPGAGILAGLPHDFYKQATFNSIFPIRVDYHLTQLLVFR
ncbi:hypothetical protein HanLR1_Chr00c0001g0688611 [Helianthus annuus]|nr:hypothetical protein HanLR1_Chr00c0001g0688611 [Helianthus annuus]